MKVTEMTKEEVDELRKDIKLAGYPDNTPKLIIFPSDVGTLFVASDEETDTYVVKIISKNRPLIQVEPMKPITVEIPKKVSKTKKK